MKRPALIDLLGIYFLLVLVCFGESFAGDPGLGWHLRTGEWIFTNAQLPHSDLFLFSAEGQAWVHNQWFADSIFWGIYRLGSMPLLHAAAIGICVGTYILVLAPFFRRYTNSALFLCSLTLLSAMLGAIQWMIRPVIFSFFLFALVYRIIYQWYMAKRQGEDGSANKSLLFLPLLFIVWVNLHPGVMIGLGVLGACLLASILEEVFKRRDNQKVSFKATRLLFVVFLFSFAATFVNPYGFQLHKDIFELLTSNYFMHLNKEWLPPEISKLAFFPFFFSVVIFLLILLKKGWRSLNPFDCLLIVGLLGMSFVQRRYIPYWGMVMVVPLLRASQIQGISKADQRNSLGLRLIGMIRRASRSLDKGERGARGFLWTSVLWVLVMIHTLFLGHLPFQDFAYSDFPDQFPRKSVAVLKNAQSNGSGRVFHHPDWGGFLIWTFYPAKRAFIDDRNSINSMERYQEFFQADAGSAVWKKIFTVHDFEWALLSEQSPLALELDADPAWVLYYKSLPGVNEQAASRLYHQVERKIRDR